MADGAYPRRSAHERPFRSAAMSLSRLSAAVLVLLALCTSAPAARAGESYDNCTGTIDALPATITTQGVWCLRGDLSTSLASGIAITVETNNVTIDCNDFKLGGLAAGTATQTVGIYASGKQN